MEESGSRLLFDEIISLPPAEGAKRIRNMEGDAETGQLDFKRKAVASKAELDYSDRKNYAKAISGFSNSDGGLVIWGVDARKEDKDPETPDIVTDFYPISKVETFVTELNSLVSRSTTPVAHRVENRAIIEDRENCKGFCLTWIPPGQSPHIELTLAAFTNIINAAAVISIRWNHTISEM